MSEPEVCAGCQRQPHAGGCRLPPETEEERARKAAAPRRVPMCQRGPDPAYAKEAVAAEAVAEALPGSTTALFVQLATALRERDEARERCRVYNCGGEPPCGKCITCQWDDTRECLAAANARADAQIAAILHTIGGMVEGHPTSAINYLQRLRALVAIEKAFADAGPMVASAKYMVEKARDCERAEEALAAARRECEELRTELAKCGNISTPHSHMRPEKP